MMSSLRSHLHAHAMMMRTIRAFFAARHVIEVHTPVLGLSGVTDPHLENMTAEFIQGKKCTPLYLQTSPEYAMKRLLAHGSGDIFQIAHAFRNSEIGRWHHPEFTLLEWYRVGFSLTDLMDEMDQLLQDLLKCNAAERYSYHDIFFKYCNIDPHHCSLSDLQHCAKQHRIADFSRLAPTIDDALQLLLSHVIEPTLGHDNPIFIYDYPTSQALLAKTAGSPPVAKRFEVYIKGIEIANGFDELTDPIEQRQRFIHNNETRQQLGLHTMPIDKALLKALEQGLPDCAGVALGLDRLFAIAQQATHLQDVMPFYLTDHDVQSEIE